MKYLLVLALLIGASASAHATTGEELQHSCRLATTVQPNQSMEKDEWLEAGSCYGQIEGVMDTLTIWHAMNGLEERTPNGEACIPSGVSVRQGALVVLKYLDAHPEKLHLLGTNLIRLAFQEAFPCKA
jgi:hypothetical protein